MLLPFQLFYHSYGFYQKPSVNTMMTVDEEWDEDLIAETICRCRRKREAFGCNHLDPRFKEKFFCGPVVTERAKSQEREKISSLNIGSKNSNKEPSPKRPCTGLWKSFSNTHDHTFGRESCYSGWANNTQVSLFGKSCKAVLMCPSNISGLWKAVFECRWCLWWQAK